MIHLKQTIGPVLQHRTMVAKEEEVSKGKDDLGNPRGILHLLGRTLTEAEDSQIHLHMGPTHHSLFFLLPHLTELGTEA
jgi:hypothetical protein